MAHDYSLPARGSLKGVYFSLGTTPSDDPELNCAQAVCSLIDNAKNTIRIAIYSLTNQEICTSLIQAHGRGIDVQIVCDLTQSKGKAMKSCLEALESAGITVKVARKQRHAMHNKVIIVDELFVATGSYNYSKNASEKNNENLIVIKGKDVADKFYKYAFLQVLENETLIRN